MSGLRSVLSKFVKAVEETDLDPLLFVCVGGGGGTNGSRIESLKHDSPRSILANDPLALIMFPRLSGRDIGGSNQYRGASTSLWNFQTGETIADLQLGDEMHWL